VFARQQNKQQQTFFPIVESYFTLEDVFESLNTSATSTQLSPSSKKVVQRLAFVASYIKFQQDESNIEEKEVIDRLVKLYQMHKRSEVSLAGSETIIRKFCG
jgi:hypothetical protein